MESVAGWSRQRLALGVGAGSVILALVGGLGIGALSYVRATAPRSDTPTTTVDTYLRTLLVERDIPAARALTCGDDEQLAAIEDIRDEAVDRERVFPHAQVRVSWGAIAAGGDPAADRVTVETDITVMGVVDGKMRSRRVETWRLTVAEENGWRVCAAHKL